LVLTGVQKSPSGWIIDLQAAFILKRVKRLLKYFMEDASTCFDDELSRIEFAAVKGKYETTVPIGIGNTEHDSVLRKKFRNEL